MKGFGILYKKMKQYFQKIFFKNFRPNIRNITYFHKNACSSIINSRIIIRIPDERALHPLQENESDIFKKEFFKNFRSNFRKMRYLNKNSCFFVIINGRIVFRISDERAWHSLQETEAIFFKKYRCFSIFDEIFEKLRSCLLFLCYWK